MAKFKCKNCGHTFEKFCDSELDSHKAVCPKCKSHWVSIDDSIIIWPTLPYSDPTYPQPAPYWTPGTGGDFPMWKKKYIVTCGDSKTSQNNIILTWGEKPKFKW